MFVPVKFLLLNSCVCVFCTYIRHIYVENGTNHVFYGELNVVTMFMILFCTCSCISSTTTTSFSYIREHAHLFIFVLVLFCSGYFEKKCFIFFLRFSCCDDSIFCFSPGLFFCFFSYEVNCFIKILKGE